MNKEELRQIADTVIAAWQLNLSFEDRKALYRAWWRYLYDLDATAVFATVDRYVLAGRRDAPRPGAVRLDTLSTGYLSPDEAWGQCQERLRCMETGAEAPDLNPLVAATMRSLSMDGQSRPDAFAFREQYRRVVADALAAEYVPPVVEE